jgi:hypothetical protein
VSPKQKTAIAALVVSAIVAVSAMFAPNTAPKCQPDPQLVEDAFGGDSSTSGPGPDLATSPPDLGAGSSSDSSGGSSS